MRTDLRDLPRVLCEGDAREYRHATVQLVVDAGFPSPECRVEYPMDGGADSPFYEWIAESFRSILPRAAALGLVPSEEVAGIDSLARRLKEEAISLGSCVPGPTMVGCLARKR